MSAGIRAFVSPWAACLTALVCSLLSASTVWADQAHDRLRQRLDADYAQTIAELIRITEVAAPPFKEQARAVLLEQLFRAQGLADVRIDGIGNVTGLRRGSGGGRLLVVAAHLDTVFPEGTPVKVRRDVNRLHAPGIGDDSLGLAALLAWIRTMDAARIRTRDDILFVANVGEEGAGNLRGTRFLFERSEYAGRISAFISVDGADASRIVNGGTGSRRYRVTFKGPGGHSYGAFGIVNPLVAAADAVQRLYGIATPVQPKTTYSASVIGGGTSVNSIPESIFVEFDLRSVDRDELRRIDQGLLAGIADAVAAENRARSTRFGSVTADVQLIGERPVGRTPDDAPLVVTALRTLTRHGYAPSLEYSSTDANVPMSLGVPAITIGTGATGGRAHSPDEFLDVEQQAFVRGLTAGLDIVLAVAGTR